MTIKALYPTVRPTLNLDFAKTKALDPRVTFTRASTATFVGANGLIQTAASGAARFDHNPTTGESLGLLVEEARTNLALYSGDFSNVAWVASETTKNANALVAPDGTITAALFVPTAVNAAHRFRQSIATATAELTFSVYLKAAGYSRIALNEQAQTGVSSAIINLTNGTGATSGTVVSNAGNGWYRVSWSSTFTTGSPKLFNVVILPNGGSGENPNSFSWTGDGTSGVYVWGAQVEAGAFPTSYIPTTTATVTRAADVASMSIASWYRQDEGTLLANFSPQRVTAATCWAAFVGPTTALGPNALLVGKASAANAAYIETRISSATQYQAIFTMPAGPMKTAYGVKSGSHQACFNGTLAAAGAGTLAPLSSNTMFIGANVAGTELLNGTIARLAFYPVRLPEAQLQALTAT